MAMKGISTLSDRFDTSRTAMFTGCTNADAYRIEELWYGIKENWQHGCEVDEFTLARMFPFAVGDVVRVSNGVDAIGYIRILAIRMANCEKFTQADFEALGFVGRDDYMKNGDMGHVRGWLLQIAHVSPDVIASQDQ